ncbi:BREX-2 system adenine-specific DNA-methyltransferase PglX [Isoptericola sp. 4D.3]|uniref:site-specific DNA-methyltransferase (adenine-specific) n=1 Tax=Isoptericola peretonis TaxID=2918523 RepID=A0ABT0J8Y3_9MICO|nr:BREX-2 system adenine-specific DNA-methyltransferase PglX [Isoptericola sp. 4D.3]
MINSSALLADLKGQLKTLQADLRERADDPTCEWGAALQREHDEALRRERTGLSWSAWRDNEVDQAAVAWIVATTFVRFCEDNDLLVGATLDGTPVPVGWIAGPGERVVRARENQTAYFRVNTSHHDRDWLQQAFRVLAAQPAGAALVDPRHNPVWTAEISAEAAKALVNFWRRTDDDGALVHDFTDPALDTRFLGDLYQDLSEHAKKTYALLQTPVFVEQFILDRTLTPAIAEFGADGLKLIDPTCGSGHFLLGAFERLNKQWAADAPGLDPKQRVRKAMDSIHGVDLNPFAVAIARFRLTVAGIQAAGEKSLVGVPGLGFHLAIGDSLLGEQGTQGELEVLPRPSRSGFQYDAEDISEYEGILTPGRYHVVVGNPPYITVRDSVAKKWYKRAYPTCHGLWTLSVPFMELFFRLARRGSAAVGAGYVGKITSNAFSKREFGKKLVETFLAGGGPSNPVDLTEVVDSSGAHIPGHNTPTVILVGRRRLPLSPSVLAVLGIRGESGQPKDAANAPVWSEIRDHARDLDYEGNYISVTQIPRDSLAVHPWSLSGGGAPVVKKAIEAAARATLASLSERIGYMAMSHADDEFTRPVRFRGLLGYGADLYPDLVMGDEVRDFTVRPNEITWFPYVDGALVNAAHARAELTALWPLRQQLWSRASFGSGTYRDTGRPWYAWHQVPADDGAGRESIAFAFVATHNHFVLDRGERVFKQTAPIIKLPIGASPREFYELLSLLNSSVACFWLHEMCLGKPLQGEEWQRRYEYDAAKVSQFPIVENVQWKRAELLHRLGDELEKVAPAVTVRKWREDPSEPLSGLIARNADAWQRLRGAMIFEQEELDWHAYWLYGLIDDDLTYRQGRAGGIAGLVFGERAFEFRLARRMADGLEDTVWFERHGSTPVADFPGVWPDDYRALVNRRYEIIESDPKIRVLERPEYKRRWATVPWEKQLRDALESAILDRLEDMDLWQDFQGPTTRSVAQLADLLRNDETLLALARELTGVPEPDLPAVFGSLAPTEAVPYLAAHRYKPSGLEKFREWQKVWELQRREDAGEKVTIPVPPKYSTPDFRKVEYWKARGKLDVPKERFILYPGVGREGDSSAVLGWAGWNHRDQAIALVREIQQQQELGASDDALVPLVAGLVELEPWLHQWHTELEPEFGSSAAQAVTGRIDQLLAQLQQTREDVTAWLPPAPTRGRRRA